MGNTYTQIYIHYIFSTKHRKPVISHKFESRLWSYLGGIARANNMIPIAIGGVQDHVHALIAIPSTVSMSKSIQLLKGGSSKWLNDNFFRDRTFRWQKGYGAFSVSESMIPKVVNYIKNQKEHHQSKTFKEEYLGLLKKYNVSFDEAYVFD
ncbi:MAG: IS200/IS605 family transposase [Balneolaceae bacterium]|nr:IS200/IS605 family transposase [Balneolaceae bacterium]